MTRSESVTAFAPGRVNLIGDHTDYTGGLAMPMAVHLGTTVSLVRSEGSVSLLSSAEPRRAEVPLDVLDPSSLDPSWARYVAGVVAELRPAFGGRGTVETTLPVGAGLSSSAALEVATALALGFEGTPLELALLCQRAEQAASGVPCGVMDQLASASGVAGHALVLDCSTLEVSPVPLPVGVDVVAVHSGEPRTLAGSAYAERRAACEVASGLLGPLRAVSLSDVSSLRDLTVRRRARHVVSENARVLAFADLLRSGDLSAAGECMLESHASLRDDFEVSTPALDALVERLCSLPGVFGARLTGAGFGGCVVALAEEGALGEGWVLEAVDGARLV